MKIIPPTRKREAVTRELRQFSGKFSSVIDLKVKLMEQFENQLPITLTFNIGYYDGRQSEKRWICDKEDLEAMYSSPALLGRKDILLWCDGRPEDSDFDNSRKKRARCHSPLTRRDDREAQIDDLVDELREMHSENHNYTEPQYRLWARMIQNGIHTSKDSPPQVPMITGAIPGNKKKKAPEESGKNTVEQTIISTATAIAKVLNSPSQITQSPHIQQTVGPQVSPSQNQPCPDRTIGLSPGRAVEIRGKCFQQLAMLKKLFEDDVLTEQELQEQKNDILGTLRKLS